jgi:excisionase family DNA binding protein
MTENTVIDGLPDKPTFRVSEVAVYYGVTERTVYLWIEHKHLETILTPRGQWRITKESLNKCRFAPKVQKEL